MRWSRQGQALCALPRRAHLPGSGTEPDLDTLRRALTPPPGGADDEPAARACAFGYGWRLLEAGFFWEAHEVWEQVWARLAPATPERLLVQSLIQVANARLKRRMGRDRAAERLKGLARGLAEEALRSSEVMGIDRACLDALIDQS